MTIGPLPRLTARKSFRVLFVCINTSWYSRNHAHLIVTRFLLVRVNDMSLSDEETHPLLKPLCERLERWRSEAGLKTYPRLRGALQDCLEVAKISGVEEELVIFAVALCEWWFRVYRPSEAGLRRALNQRLSDPQYIPHSHFSRNMLKTHKVPPAINEIVDRHLAKSWEPDASEEMNHLCRDLLLDKTEKLIREMARPFLVSEWAPLPPKQGGYPDCAPWVAAIAVHRRTSATNRNGQSFRSLDAAFAVVKALRGKMPDKSLFHRKKRELQERAPNLIDQLLDSFEKAKFMIVQDETIQPLLDEDCFPSIRQCGGWSLLVGQVPDTPECFDNSIKS